MMRERRLLVLASVAGLVLATIWALMQRPSAKTVVPLESLPKETWKPPVNRDAAPGGIVRQVIAETPARVRVIDKVSRAPVATAVVIAVEDTQLRELDATNSRTVATVDSAGNAELPNSVLAELPSPSTLLVAASGYQTSVLPESSLDETATRLVELDPGMSFDFSCVRDDGSPMEGVLIALSRHNVHSASFTPKRGPQVYAGIDTKMAIHSATTGADGTVRLKGLTPGRYRVHASHETAFAVDGLHRQETVTVPGNVRRIVFRDLECAILDAGDHRLRAFQKAVNMRYVVRNTGSAVFGAARAFAHLRRKWPNAAIWVAAPRASMALKGIPVTFHMALENGAVIQRDVKTHAISEAHVDRLGSVSPSRQGKCLVKVVGQAGESYDGLQIRFFRRQLEFQGETGAEIALPVGTYRYEVGGHSSFSVWRDVGVQALEIKDAGESVIKQHTVRMPCAAFRLAVSFPYKEHGTNLTLRLTDGVGKTHYLFNWHPKRQATPLVLATGRCSVKVSARDIASELITFELTRQPEPAIISIPLKAMVLR